MKWYLFLKLVGATIVVFGPFPDKATCIQEQEKKFEVIPITMYHGSICAKASKMK